MTNEKTKNFKDMTDTEKRIAIAKDVLAQLAIGRLEANHSYLTSDVVERFIRDAVSPDDDLKRAVVAEKNCQACALGSLFVSAAGLSPKPLTVEDNWSKEPEDRWGEVSPTTMTDYLSDVFTVAQLWLIEDAYETMNMYGYEDEGGGEYNDAEAVQAAIHFGKGFEDDRWRLMAIMENIVKNDGEFRP